MRQPGLVRGISPKKKNKRNATVTGVAVPTYYSIYFCSENFPRKERIQSFLNCSTNFWGRIKILQTQSISSHRGGGNHWPDDVKSSCGNESSARSLKIEMNIWDLTSVSEKSMQQKTAIVSNKDRAPFYHSFFFRFLKSSLSPKKTPQSAIFWRKNLRNLGQEEMALDLSSKGECGRLFSSFFHR